MEMKPLKYKNNWLCADGKRFETFADAESYMFANNVGISLFSDVLRILKQSRTRGYVLFKDRIVLLRCVYFCMHFKRKEYLINQINIIMAKKKAKPNETLNGLTDRHVAAIIRRKMMSKDHGDLAKYNRKDKSWQKDLKND